MNNKENADDFLANKYWYYFVMEVENNDTKKNKKKKGLRYKFSDIHFIDML